MEEKEKKSAAAELDLKQIATTLLRKSWIIIVVSILCAAIAFVWTFYFVTPQYKSSTKFYVNNSKISVGDVSMGLSVSDLSAAQELVNSYIVILQSRESLDAIIDYAGVNMSTGALKGMITAAPVNSTEIFEVTITCPDRVLARDLADAIAAILPSRINEIIEGTSCKVVERPIVASGPSSPNYSKNTIVGFLAGVLVSALAIFLYAVFDVTIRSDEDVQRVCNVPVLASVPDMSTKTKGGYYYTDKKRTPASTDKETSMVGSNISFAAVEAYKLLRTKLQFSFADEGNCRVIGVSSALTGEGKSLSAVNLAYTTSLLGKRVLLIDCDMRRSSVSEKLPIKRFPGLSEFLSGQSHAEKLIQLCGIKDDERAFHAIASGRTPPNPIELLSSERMNKMLEHLRENYDYIILDLPPVGEVSDALAVAKFTDGMLVVVRQNYCDRVVLSSAVRQFEFVDAKILGVVFNSTVENGGIGKKYYKRYYKKYDRSYEAAAKAGRINRGV